LSIASDQTYLVRRHDIVLGLAADLAFFSLVRHACALAVCRVAS
jgi:hypothetical protein